MRFSTIIAASVGAMGLATAVALPHSEHAIERRNATAALALYGTRCNNNNLNAADFGKCLERFASVQNNQCLVPPLGSGHFCQQGNVYFSGVKWSDEGDLGLLSAPCSTVLAGVKRILGQCGYAGGSTGVWGSDGEDLIVHVTDHNVG
ncbi:hypothetical protein BT63DRAFT_409357 [Microthyrium microscopicum]|uniref:Ecp2 effector protein domain-containing protein n=1 Tax=Microthyrium microscopicum TaxID=703497 RepID=A0A6A6UU06_9PEZI|nr:hypothetical protein BT63DRAFT_409357 [Microthyrium microscopicum]